MDFDILTSIDAHGPDASAVGELKKGMMSRRRYALGLFPAGCNSDLAGFVVDLRGKLARGGQHQR